MGTSFYWIVNAERRTPAGRELPDCFDSDHPAYHIGKRCGAGFYCFDCDETLCSGGLAAVHTGAAFLERCPVCGNEPEANRPVTLERGVGRACSFMWAQNPKRVRRVCRNLLDEEVVVDENGERYTGSRFLVLLDRCPIEFTDSIGTRFS